MDFRRMLLEENVGGYDLMARALAGSVAVTALALELVGYPWTIPLALIALVGLYSGMTRHCTPYALLGLSTAVK